MAASSKVLLLTIYTTLLLLSCLVVSSNASLSIGNQVHGKRPPGVRRLLLKAESLDEEDKPNPPPKKTKQSTATATSQPKSLTKSSPTSDQLPLQKPKVKKLNSTTTSTTKLNPTTSKNSTTLITTKPKKPANTTSKATDSTTKSPDLITSASLKNKTSKIIKNPGPPNSTTTPKLKKITTTDLTKSKTQQNPNPNPKISNPKPKQTANHKQNLPSWIDQDEEDDLVNGFRDLPSKFQQTLLPDLESISQTSKAYLTSANTQMTKNFKPIVGKKYASTTANIVSFIFIILPLFLVSLLISRIKTYFSLQKLLIFINIYLAIYFSILSLSAVVTGIEPLRFLFATSTSTYVGIQILQTLCYVMYLLLLVMYLVLVFSTVHGLGSKLLGLAQTLLGFAVGLHYYVAVFHRVVLHQPPKTNWKVHGIYATCFLLISLFASAERRKKEYLEEGGEEGKKS